MALNLDPAQRILEREMTDSITISRPGRNEDGTWNESTGTMTPPAPTVVYDGKCIVSNRNNIVGRTVMEGQAAVSEVEYKFRLPLDSGATIQENDTIVVNESLRDPDLVGQEFLVDVVTYSTFQVSKTFRAKLRVIHRDP